MSDDVRVPAQAPSMARVVRGVVAAVLAAALATGTSACTRPVWQPPPPSPSAVATTPPTSGHEPGWSQPKTDPLYPAYGNPDLDVLSYQLTLTWTPATNMLSGVAKLVIRPTRDVTELSLDFADSYTVDGSTVDGAAETPGRRGNDIVVPAGRILAKDTHTTLAVTYHGVPRQVPFPSDRSDAAEGLGLRPTPDHEAWTMQEPYGAATWYPANDHPSDEALYDISVTVPAGWTAVASGTPSGSTTSAAGVTYRYTSADPVATYLVTLAIGHYTKVTATGPGGVPITSWLRTGKDEAYAPAVARLPELLTWLTDHYGPYPFPTAGVVFVDSESAMETQQMVTMGAKATGTVPNIPETTEVLLHELSHQWFGDSVTPDDWLGLWLNEGFAMYTEMLWTIDQKRYTEAQWVSTAASGDNRSRASAGPPGHPRADHFAENNVYFGPALMLREIRLQVGDTEFFAMARDWVQTQRNQPVNRADFVAFVNKHTGKDLTSLINQWLDSPTTPTPTPVR
jgi:aminopeptidase N